MKHSHLGNPITPESAMPFPRNTAWYHHPPIFQAASSQCSNTYPLSYSSLRPQHWAAAGLPWEEQPLTVITAISDPAWAQHGGMQLQGKINCWVLQHFQIFEEVYSFFIPVVDWAIYFYSKASWVFWYCVSLSPKPINCVKCSYHK